jgi:hypothetical protein
MTLKKRRRWVVSLHGGIGMVVSLISFVKLTMHIQPDFPQLFVGSSSCLQERRFGKNQSEADTTGY